MIAPERIVAEAEGLDFQAIFLAEKADGEWPHDIGRVTPGIFAGSLEGIDVERVAAMLCGPGAMMCAICDLLHGAGVPLSAIEYERFDYADGARSAKDRRMLAAFAGMGVTVVAAIAAFAWR